jgi:hypothetical protein
VVVRFEGKFLRLLSLMHFILIFQFSRFQSIDYFWKIYEQNFPIIWLLLGFTLENVE